MPGRDPADESPRVIAPVSQLGYGLTTDLKSANAINHDGPVARQRLDPLRQRGRSVHGDTGQHVGASGEVLGQAEIEQERSAATVIPQGGLQLFGPLVQVSRKDGAIAIQRLANAQCALKLR